MRLQLLQTVDKPFLLKMDLGQILHDNIGQANQHRESHRTKKANKQPVHNMITGINRMPDALSVSHYLSYRDRQLIQHQQPTYPKEPTV